MGNLEFQETIDPLLNGETGKYVKTYNFNSNGNAVTEPNNEIKKRKSLTNTDHEKSGTELDEIPLLYGIEDVPPWYMCVFLGFQHYLEMVGATVACPFFLTPAICMLDDDPNRANIISTLVFMSGIITILQSTLGSTLPIVQGGSFSYLIPTLAIMSLPKWKCPDPEILEAMSEEDRTECWQVRMRELQGAIIFAALFETLLAFTGIIGLVLKYITPLTVAPAIFLIGASLFKQAANECAKSWPVSAATIVLLIVFSQHLSNLKLTFPCKDPAAVDPKTAGKFKFPLFKVFPVLMTLVLVWGVCAILTVTDVLEPGNLARTDAKAKLFANAPWFRIPYPLQWGIPTVSIGAVLGVMSGVMASMIESVGDYYACARIGNTTIPPTHAINRGIFCEGLGCVLSGFWGSGNGSTSYSNNIGTLCITKVASRRVIQVSGVIMIILSLVGKAGAVFVGIPDPIIGGLFCFVFPLIMAVAFHVLQDVDLSSSRNIFIASFSIFFGLLVSEWIKATPDAINTGNEMWDNIIQILLGTGMFLAGFIGFLLDNTIPGTPEERGLVHFLPPKTEGLVRDTNYDLPFGMRFIQKIKLLQWLPISPTFDEHPFTKIPSCNKKKMDVN